MSPADGPIPPPEKTIGLGVPRFVWLKALKISVRTAEVHKARILDALGVRSTAELVQYAIRNGIISV